LFSKKNTSGYTEVFFLVAPPREIWNRIFSEIERLKERLEQLGIDILMEADDVGL